MFRDLRYSIGTLLKRPGFTFVVVATLALGIGVNAAIFSVFNILLRPLPVKEPESIVRLYSEEAGHRSDSFSFPDYAYIRDHNQSFSDVLAVFEVEHFLLGDNRPNNEPEEIVGNFVSDVVAGGPTHTRNRHSHGVGSTGTQRSHARAETGNEAGAHRRRHWHSGVTRRGAGVIEFVGGLDNQRRAHDWSRYRVAGGSDSAGVLSTGAPRNASRSVGDAAV